MLFRSELGGLKPSSSQEKASRLCWEPSRASEKPIAVFDRGLIALRLGVLLDDLKVLELAGKFRLVGRVIFFPLAASVRRQPFVFLRLAVEAVIDVLQGFGDHRRFEKRAHAGKCGDTTVHFLRGRL